ncbi:hypothetical protein DSM03_1011223 [Leeuwenhoekiella aestuarii]|uniref:Uncharacterized protein n=1 Tax=Leeuwenhoekiella aestuarii TaxID=2249426 RepID=A0A4V1KQ07_9FLAO|nr:hypothetical protein DSM04_101734 [Leeuwenhoekiella aestuarii]RXG19837.1 hypothetical protein DSM03_1011223 [Leeuwenhoekiella aestuarii]
MFKLSQKDYLLNQLEYPKTSLKKLFPNEKKELLQNFDSKNEINKSSNENYLYHTTPRIYLTNPIISKDGKYALIWYSKTTMGEGYSVMCLYELKNKKWKISKVRELTLG